jgi:hypothetical protein
MTKNWFEKDSKQRKERGVSVNDVLASVNDMEFDEIIVMGFKDGRPFHSMSVADGHRAVGLLEQLKNTMLNK